MKTQPNEFYLGSSSFFQERKNRVTRLGDLFDFGQLFRAFGNN